MGVLSVYLQMNLPVYSLLWFGRLYSKYILWLSLEQQQLYHKYYSCMWYTVLWLNTINFEINYETAPISKLYMDHYLLVARLSFSLPCDR